MIGKGKVEICFHLENPRNRVRNRSELTNKSAISRQNSSTTFDDTLTNDEPNSTTFDNGGADDQFSNNCQISFIESLVEIGRRLVTQPDRESKTQRLISELNQVNLHLPSRVWNPISDDTNHFIGKVKELRCSSFYVSRTHY